MSNKNPILVSISGLLVGGFSLYLVYFKGLNKFLLFMIIGFVMFAYGFISYLIINAKEKKHKRDHKENKTINDLNNHPLSKWLMKCPYCNANIPNNSIFCPYCGRRIKQ